MPECLAFRPLDTREKMMEFYGSYTENTWRILLFGTIHQSHPSWRVLKFLLSLGWPYWCVALSPFICAISSSYCCPVPLFITLFALSVQFIGVACLIILLYTSWILWVYNFRIVTFHFNGVLDVGKLDMQNVCITLGSHWKIFATFTFGLGKSLGSIKSSNLLFNQQLRWSFNMLVKT